MVNEAKYKKLSAEMNAGNITLVAVSKMKPPEDIQALYDLGQRDFGENYVQELMDKQAMLPADIRWHFIGHLQSNKVKYIASFIHLIHSADSTGLLKEINKQAAKHTRVIKCLLQVHISGEATKFGFDEGEVLNIRADDYPNITISGLMGMATNTEDNDRIISDFTKLKSIFETIKSGKQITDVTRSDFNTLSMGMSDDYGLGIECGSNMVRIGSLLFGRR